MIYKIKAKVETIRKHYDLTLTDIVLPNNLTKEGLNLLTIGIIYDYFNDNVKNNLFIKINEYTIERK